MNILREVKKIGILMVFFISIGHAYAQKDRHKIGFGALLGTHTPIGAVGFQLAYLPVNRLEIKAGFGSGDYEGGFLGIETAIAPVAIKKVVKPFVSVGYSFTTGDKKIALATRDEKYIGTYKVAPNQYLVPGVGVRIDFPSKDRTGFISLSTGWNYFYRQRDTMAEYVKGDISSDIENQINKTLHYKWGFYIGVIAYLGKERK